MEPGTHFASVNAGLRGYVTRHNLAAAYHELERLAEAEAHWKAALAERPGYEPAWRGLMGVFLQQQRWQELEELARGLETGPDGPLQSAVVRGRATRRIRR